MEPTLLKKYVQSIEDFVFIEEKIVTYLWLSRVLKIHANTAKQLLYALSIKEDTKDKLLITYALGGELKNGKGKLLKLVIADSVESVKQRFSEVTTDHVYSIQRSGGYFSSTDVFNSYPHLLISEEIRKFCPIQLNGEIEKREVKHMTEIKNFLNDKPITKQAAPKLKEEPKKEIKNGDINKSDKEDGSNHCIESTSKTKKLSANEKLVKNAKAGSLGSFFNRQTEKKSLEPPADKKEKAEKKEEKPKTGLNAFFKTGNKSDPLKKETKEKEVITSLETKPAENDEEVTGQENVERSPSVSAKGKKPTNKTNKRKRKEKDDGGKKKRRKRIVSAISSGSESSGNESSECEMEVEPEQPPHPPPEDDDEDMIPPTPGRKRVRKQIDKVFTDDDGYIITKKEFVYESCSEDEAKEEKKENIENNLKNAKETVQSTPEKKKEISPKNSKKNKTNINANNDNKQSSIMNFFKRKATSKKNSIIN